MESTKKWEVDMFVKGRIKVEIEAETREEALRKAWAMYHDAEVGEDLEWDVDDIDVSEIKQ